MKTLNMSYKHEFSKIQTTRMIELQDFCVLKIVVMLFLIYLVLHMAPKWDMEVTEQFRSIVH